MGEFLIDLEASRMYQEVTLMDPTMSGGSQISETWGNPLSEVPENPLSSNDPFNVDLESGPKIKFLPTKHIQRTQNIIEVKKGCSVQIKVEHATSELQGYGIVHNNPEIF